MKIGDTEHTVLWSARPENDMQESGSKKVINLKEESLQAVIILRQKSSSMRGSLFTKVLSESLRTFEDSTFTTRSQFEDSTFTTRSQFI